MFYFSTKTTLKLLTPSSRNRFILKRLNTPKLIIIRVSDSLHFNADPEQIPIFVLIFFCERYKTHNDVFFVILSLLFTYIKQNKRFCFKKLYSYNFGWFLYEFITIYFLLPGSRSKFPEVDPDPDPDPAKLRIQRNTDYYINVSFSISYISLFSEWPCPGIKLGKFPTSHTIVG